MIKRQRGHFRSQFCSLLPNWWQLKFSIQNNTVLLGNHGPLWEKSNILWKIVDWAIFGSFCPLLPNFGQTRMFGTQTNRKKDRWKEKQMVNWSHRRTIWSYSLIFASFGTWNHHSFTFDKYTVLHEAVENHCSAKEDFFPSIFPEMFGLFV